MFAMQAHPGRRFPYQFHVTISAVRLASLRFEDNPFHPVFDWCHEQFGESYNCEDSQAPEGVRWIFHFHRGFAFCRENDAFAFRIRWC